MKLMTFFLVFCLSAQAFGSTVNELMERHSYFLSVEWDQQDRELLKQNNEKLVQELRSLPAAELEDYLTKTVSPEKLNSYKTNLSEAMKSGEHQDLTSLLQTVSQNSQARGANWNAVGVTLAVTGGIALSLFAAYTWFYHNQLECDGFYDCHGGE